MRALGLAVLVAASACGDNRTIELAFAACGSGTLECGTLDVPADWSAPNGPTIALRVVRAPARDPARRIGVLAFNFGGPGEPTLAPIVASYPNAPLATSIDLSQYFDFIAIDWRGVAMTNPMLGCLTSSTGAALSQQRFAPHAQADWDALFALSGEITAGCTANAANVPLLAHQDSVSAARDLDALRAALGEDTLNYLGFSYGTRLGAMYATLFPEHARAIALDSPMLPVPQIDTFLTEQSVSFSHAFDRFFAWCAAASTFDCPFRSSSDPAAIAAAYEQLLATADSSPVTSNGIALDRPTIDLAVTSQMYFPSYEWPTIAAALARLASGDGSTLARIFTNNAIDSASSDNSFSSYQNVCAQDIPLPAALATPAGFAAFAATLDPLAPHVGLQNAAAQAFALDWPTKSQPHPIGSTTAPPLLITTTANDPATPHAWALELQAALANGSYLVTYDGDGHSSSGAEPCLGDAIAAFLIDPSTPPGVTDCPEVPPTLITRELARALYRPGSWKRR